MPSQTSYNLLRQQFLNKVCFIKISRLTSFRYSWPQESQWTCQNSFELFTTLNPQTRIPLRFFITHVVNDNFYNEQFIKLLNHQFLYLFFFVTESKEFSIKETENKTIKQYFKLSFYAEFITTRFLATTIVSHKGF